MNVLNNSDTDRYSSIKKNILLKSSIFIYWNYDEDTRIFWFKCKITEAITWLNLHTQ